MSSHEGPKGKDSPDGQAPAPLLPAWPGALVTWFLRHARDLPWRRNHDPYHVWLSEVMLQQTQVERVLQYFPRWLDRFPDIRTVANAPIETILAHWQGLGYYSRARNFHRAAQILVAEQGGQIPASFEDLLRLPGIGRYTAGAIMAFAYNEPHPTIEANTERVYARLVDETRNLKQHSVYRLMEQRLTSWIPEGQARLFNQGLMELGSLVCSPRQPRCDICPLADVCLAGQRGTTEQRPVLPPKKARIKVRSVALAVQRADGAVLFFQRPPTGLWAGFWELPNKQFTGPHAPGKTGAEGRAPSVRQRESLPILATLLQELAPILSRAGCAPKPADGLYLGTVRHSYTRYSAALDCYLLRLDRQDAAFPPPVGAPDQAGSRHRWVPIEATDDLPLHAGHRKCMALVQAQTALR